MAKEHQIVSQINTTLTQAGGQFDSKRFQKGRVSGIAELFPSQDGDDTHTVPMVVTNDGVETILGIDDTFSAELYHRHLTSTFEDIENDYGSRKFRQQTANMILIFIGDRGRLKLNKEELTNGIILGMPLELGNVFLVTNSLYSAQIIPGSFNFNRQDVWSGEYNTDVQLSTNQVMFSFTYDIQTVAKDDCINLCE